MSRRDGVLVLVLVLVLGLAALSAIAFAPGQDIAPPVKTTEASGAATRTPIRVEDLPRPNPGPEPWPAPQPVGWLVAGGVLLVALVLLAARRAWRRRRAPQSAAAFQEGADADAETAELAQWSGRIRTVLAARFGAGWAAKTTEELAVSRELAEAFGEDRLARLAEFLREADRVKFGGEAIDHQGDAWRGWVAEFLEAARAGRTSRSNGK